MVILNPVTRAVQYVQGNDLLYRTSIDTFSYDVPLVMMSRNKDERRENYVAIFMQTGLGFLLAPLHVIFLNNLFSKNIGKNTALYNLQWQHLDKNNLQNAIAHLHKMRSRAEEKILHPNTIDKIFMKSVKQKFSNLTLAIKDIAEQPELLEKVFKTKKKVLAMDLIVASIISSSIGPLKNWITRTVTHNDRFTGTKNYLSDEELKQLVGEKKGLATRKKVINFALIFMPTTLALITIALTKKNLFKGSFGKFIRKFRDGMDYDSGVFLKVVASCFAVSNVKWFNMINVARDKYERAEIALKFALVVPWSYFGDLFINGNIARLVDNYYNKKHGTAKGTFINLKRSNSFMAVTSTTRDVIDDVKKTLGEAKAKNAGKMASGLFILSFIIHCLSIMGFIAAANRVTFKKVNEDLTKSTAHKSNESKQNLVYPIKRGELFPFPAGSGH